MAAAAGPAQAQGMGAEQAGERNELEQMRNELNDIKGTVHDAQSQMEQLRSQQAPSGVKEFHLFAKRATCEISPGRSIECLTYNGKLPGPMIRVEEGDPVRIILHNQLTVPTSLLIHGMSLPQEVSGLPRKQAGTVAPGQAYAFQFIARQAGTFWYHPQVPHADQKMHGMSGVIIVDSKSQPGTAVDKDIVAMLEQVTPLSGTTGSASPVYLFNGKEAPAIPPIQVRKGDKVRLRLINSGEQSVPLSLSGHRLEVEACNGSDALEPHVFRDTLTLNPSDRCDVDFVADNTGVWSLASERFDQTTRDGKFPGGIACIVRYIETGNE